MADYGKGPSKEDWARHAEITNTGFRGWNVFQRLPVIMKVEIPWMREWAIGFANDDDMGEFTAQGWRPLRADHFGKDGLSNFNQTIGLRFNLESVDGTVKYKKHYLMIKPKDLREQQIKEQNDAFEEYYSAITRQAYVHPQDPRAAEMAAGSYAKLDEERHVRQPTKIGNID